MESTPMVACYLIRFSEAAISKLKLDQKVELRTSLNNACINFRHYSAGTATNALVTLFYGDRVKREEILRKLFRNMSSSPFEDDLKKHPQDIPEFNEEEYQTLANELLYQYSAANPGVLTVETDCPEYQKELDNLKKSMNQHPVLLFRAVQMCKVVSHVEPVASRCIGLLLSKNVVCQRIGLEMIGFNFQHRVLLFPYAKKIGLLLQAMHKANDNLISPFATWLNQHEEIDFSSNSLDHSVHDELPLYLLLSEFKNFLDDNSEIIRSLPNSALLKDCLILYKENLNLLLEKEAYSHLTEAIVTFLYAKRFYQEAQQEFSMGNPETFAPLSKSVKILEKAKVSYNTALDAFVKSCS